jgi:hypothetical protein
VKPQQCLFAFVVSEREIGYVDNERTLSYFRPEHDNPHFMYPQSDQPTFELQCDPVAVMEQSDS